MLPRFNFGLLNAPANQSNIPIIIRTPMSGINLHEPSVRRRDEIHAKAPSLNLDGMEERDRERGSDLRPSPPPRPHEQSPRYHSPITSRPSSSESTPGHQLASPSLNYMMWRKGTVSEAQTSGLRLLPAPHEQSPLPLQCQPPMRVCSSFSLNPRPALLPTSSSIH